SSGRLDVDSSILWDNTNAEIGDDSPSTLNVTVVYSDVDGGYTGTGNQNVTPGFVSQSTGDYRLAGTSALLDDGNPSPSSIDASDVDDDGNTREEAPDLDHEARRQDDGIEPGAYEIAGEECGADVDGDDDVDFVDLVTLLADYDDPYTFVDLLLVIAQYGCGTTDPDCPGTEGLDEIIKDAGLSDADWKTLIDCIETGTTSEQINCACWLQHYLEDCVPSCPNLPDCPDDDPLSKH
ncbi:MAG: hypothetical protein KJO43_02265, partial [Phycisphaerae bacterium]|nr:hypothetical protein [Phycisphaerae bacterium]